MVFKKKEILVFCYISVGFFAFFLNYWASSRGAFPLDTFVHFDSAARILNQEYPIRDFWIIHGFFIDFLQSLFFKIFGVKWVAYILHSSIFNSVIAIFTFKIFTEIELKILPAFILTICISTLAYPISGTPFLDLHSAFFSLFALYFLIIFIKKGSYFNIFFSIIFLGFAFLSKQVPAGYFIFFVGIFILIYSFKKKNYMPIVISFFSLVFFLIILSLYIKISNTGFNNFILQVFSFPSEIARDRQTSYDLNIKNVFLNFKFIYLFLVPLTIIYFKSLTEKKSSNIINLSYFYLVVFYSLTLIYHQIYTKNQIFIFYLIPILCAFLIYFCKNSKININKKYFNIFVITLCVLITIKYHYRFVEKRKFHELVNVDLNQAVKVNFEENFFNDLKWITPHYKNPKEELNLIENFYKVIKNEKSKMIVITDYNFISGLLNKKLHSPSRTFDNISYPKLNSKLYSNYKSFFRTNILKNNIKIIYLFYPKMKDEKKLLNHIVFNYLPKNCYKSPKIESKIIKIEIKSCKYLTN